MRVSYGTFREEEQEWPQKTVEVDRGTMQARQGHKQPLFESLMERNKEKEE